MSREWQKTICRDCPLWDSWGKIQFMRKTKKNRGFSQNTRETEIHWHAKGVGPGGWPGGLARGLAKGARVRGTGTERKKRKIKKIAKLVGFFDIVEKCMITIMGFSTPSPPGHRPGQCPWPVPLASLPGRSPWPPPWSVPLAAPLAGPLAGLPGPPPWPAP